MCSVSSRTTIAPPVTRPITVSQRLVAIGPRSIRARVVA